MAFACMGALPAASVELEIQRVGPNLVASWAASATNFYLEVSSDLNDSAGWRNVDDSLVLHSGESCQFYIDPASTAQYYRLKSWEILFDGTSTAAFRGYRQSTFPTGQWTVTAAGELKTIPGSGSTHMITRNQYDSFELEWEWKTGVKGNSGVMIRVAEIYSDAYMSGPEYQLTDESQSALPANQTTGAVYGILAPSNRVLNPTGQWNQCRMSVRGNHVEHWLNGFQITTYELNSPQFLGLVANSSFKSYPLFGKAGTGYIAFQNWTPEVWFRNIRVRAIPANP